MIVIGLTGSIGMGKSTVAQMFAQEGAPAFDSDDAVHALYAQGGAAVAPVEAAFPGVMKDGAIDRQALSARVVEHPEAIKKLEGIVHPLVRQAQGEFLEAHRSAAAVVLDIPLLLNPAGAAPFTKTVWGLRPREIHRVPGIRRPALIEWRFASRLSVRIPHP